VPYNDGNKTVFNQSNGIGNQFRRLLGPLIITILSTGFSYFILSRMGMKIMVIALAGIIVAGLLAKISINNLSYALMGWFLSMGPIRSIGMVTMPGLPDFSIDRIMLIWIVGILILRVILGKTRFDGPYLADFLVIIQTFYIWSQMQYMNDVGHFHEWVLSSLSPLFGFIYGKYVARDEKFIKTILMFFFFLTVYFYVTAIAEHFHWNALIWPKAILNPDQGFWIPGRSRGPLLHPPLFGQVLGIIGMVHFIFLIKAKKSSTKVLILISFALTMLGEFFAYTRGPWVATAGGIALLGILRPNYRKIILVFAIIGFLGGILGLMQLANSDFFQERMNSQNTVENRLGFLANAFRMIKDHPIFGIGFFQYMDKVGDYNQTSYIPFYGMVKSKLSYNVPIHDIYLGRTAEEGFFGIGLIFAFYLVILKSWVSLWRRKLQKEWLNNDLLALFAGMMACYLIGGMIIDYRYFDFINVIFYFLAGIVYGFDVRLRKTS